MSTVTMLIRELSGPRLRILEEYVQALLMGLRVKTGPIGPSARGFVQVGIFGEDENTAVNYLSTKIGLCPISVDNIKETNSVRGFVSEFDKNNGEMSVDIGIVEPKPVDAKVELTRLQAQLCDGRRIAPQKIQNLFGLYKNVPLTIRILRPDAERERIDACLAEEQISSYRNWMESFLDRLIVVNTSRSAIEFALKKSGMFRDVIETEELGLFEHVLVCKLGTDAVGLIPKIGRILPEAIFNIFSPRKILKFFGGDFPLLNPS